MNKKKITPFYFVCVFLQFKITQDTNIYKTFYIHKDFLNLVVIEHLEGFHISLQVLGLFLP